VRQAGRALRRQWSGWQLDDESRGARDSMVLPANGASRVAGQTCQREPGAPGKSPLDGPIAFRVVDDAQRLVEPDGDFRAQANDERVRDAGLGLGQRTRSGELEVSAAAERTPPPGEVPVQVNPARVLAPPRGPSIGVEIGHQPHRHPGWCGRALEQSNDGLTGGLVAMDDPHYQDAPPPGGRADDRGGDRAPPNRVAQKNTTAEVPGHSGARPGPGRRVTGSLAPARPQ
jgi:hypothetical protein